MPGPTTGAGSGRPPHPQGRPRHRPAAPDGVNPDFPFGSHRGARAPQDSWRKHGFPVSPIAYLTIRPLTAAIRLILEAESGPKGSQRPFHLGNPGLHHGLGADGGRGRPRPARPPPRHRGRSADRLLHLPPLAPWPASAKPTRGWPPLAASSG